MKALDNKKEGDINGTLSSTLSKMAKPIKEMQQQVDIMDDLQLSSKHELEVRTLNLITFGFITTCLVDSQMYFFVMVFALDTL